MSSSEAEESDGGRAGGFAARLSGAGEWRGERVCGREESSSICARQSERSRSCSCSCSCRDKCSSTSRYPDEASTSFLAGATTGRSESTGAAAAVPVDVPGAGLAADCGRK